MIAATFDTLHAAEQIDLGFEKLDKKIDIAVQTLDKKIDTEIGKLDKKMDLGFEKLDKKIDTSVGKLDAKIGHVQNDMKHVRWMFGILMVMLIIPLFKSLFDF